MAKRKRTAANAATLNQPSFEPALITGLTATSGPAAQTRLGGPDAQLTKEAESLVTPAAVYLYKQARWTPITNLTPESLAAQLQEWTVGFHRRFALTMDTVEERDAVIKSVTGKLKMALSRRTFEIVKVEGAEPGEADAHSDALRYFYNNLTATSAVDRNVRGGFNRLVHLMMEAALKKYAPFEIVWEPRGDNLTATFVHVPLYFFESRTGVLRFSGNFAWDGLPLKDKHWMIACGEGIMVAIVVAWMYKTLSLRDWLIYSERNGMPIPAAFTNYAPGTAGYAALETALQSLGPDTALILGLQDKIDKLEFGSAGALPYPELVSYIDKVICALARGADLGSMSAGNTSEGQGASLQGDESDLIEQHYGTMITETLNHYVDRNVLRWHFGEDVEPLAYCRLNIPKRLDINIELQVDEKLLSWGVELGVENALERYGRVEAGPGDALLTSPMAMFGGGGFGELPPGEEPPQLNENNPLEAAQSRLTRSQARRAGQLLLKQSCRRMAHLCANANKPLVTKLRNVCDLKSDTDFVDALKGLKLELPRLRRIADSTSVKEVEGALTINAV